jgi:hypothetical protein
VRGFVVFVLVLGVFFLGVVFGFGFGFGGVFVPGYLFVCGGG